jgi:hypothetical protein
MEGKDAPRVPSSSTGSAPCADSRSARHSPRHAPRPRTEAQGLAPAPASCGPHGAQGVSRAQLTPREPSTAHAERAEHSSRRESRAQLTPSEPSTAHAERAEHSSRRVSRAQLTPGSASGPPTSCVQRLLRSCAAVPRSCAGVPSPGRRAAPPDAHELRAYRAHEVLYRTRPRPSGRRTRLSPAMKSTRTSPLYSPGPEKKLRACPKFFAASRRLIAPPPAALAGGRARTRSPLAGWAGAGAGAGRLRGRSEGSRGRAAGRGR